MLRLADVLRESIVDGPGLRFVVFAQGCRKRCEGCHNPTTHEMDGGRGWEVDELLAMIRQNPLLDGVTLTGGEPFLQAPEMARLAKACRKEGLDVVVYSGYKWEELLDMQGAAPLLSQTDYLVDGEYEKGKRSLELRFRGSSNQRVVDVGRSLEKGRVCEIKWEESYL